MPLENEETSPRPIISEGLQLVNTHPANPERKENSGNVLHWISDGGLWQQTKPKRKTKHTKETGKISLVIFFLNHLSIILKAHKKQNKTKHYHISKDHNHIKLLIH